MTLRVAVAASLLPASRSRVASTFKSCRHLPGEAPLDFAAAACHLEPARAVGAACAQAEAMLSLCPPDIEPVPWSDIRYPPLLDCTSDPPPVLWIRGQTGALSRPTVAIVGSRAATEYARQVAHHLGGQLAARGVVVVSGLARGVDSAAHRGCLDAGGPTIAVLGSGVDRIYPAEHDALAARIREHGALVSELGPGAPPLPEHFPLRNRIISGLSLGIVIVEASDKSGSLITARCALEQGRDVMVVPGSVLSGRNAGSHSLLKDGARIVESVDDILGGLGWLTSGVPDTLRARLTADPVLDLMEPGESYRLDELMVLTGLEGPKLLPRLMELELEGHVVAAATGTFTRKARG
jgi:DNA processing protein